MLTDKQRQAGAALFGADLLARLIAEAEQQTKELEQAGVATKAARVLARTKADLIKPDLDELAAAVTRRTKPAIDELAAALDELQARVSELEASINKAEKAARAGRFSDFMARQALSAGAHRPGAKGQPASGAAAFFQHRPPNGTASAFFNGGKK